MSAAADALQPQLVRELLALRGRGLRSHFADVLIDAPRSGYHLDFDVGAGSITVDFGEPTFLGAALGADASRFAAAAFWSFKGVPADVENAERLAWGLIRAYYAAFYAGHAVLRLLGRSCSYLETRHVQRIRQLADALGNTPPFVIGAGLYSCQFDAGQTGFTMIHARGRVGGAHETFWEIFDGFLGEITEEVLLARIAPSDARNVFLKLESLRKITKRGAGASWLSSVRNEIQYNHIRGVWWPQSVNRTTRGILSRAAEQWSRDPMEIDVESPPGAEMGSFVMACAFLTALCREVLKRVADRSSEGANSFARGTLALAT